MSHRVAPCAHWFSPLAPDAGHVAELAALVLPALREATDCNVWESVASGAATKFPGARAWTGELEPESLADGVPFYHLMDRPAECAPILRLARQRPGIVVLHDRALAALCLDAVRRGGMASETYRQAIVARWGSQAGALVDAALAQAAPLDADPVLLTPHELVLEKALGVVVHGDESFQRIADFERWPVRRLRLPCPVPPEGLRPRLEPRDFRQQPLLLTILAVDGLRGVAAVATALSDWPRRDCVRLRVVVRPALLAACQREIERCGAGLQAQIQAVTEALPQMALADADAGVELGDAGDDAAGFRRQLLAAHGLPVLVRHSSWHTEPAPEEVAFARTDSAGEREDVQRFLALALDQPQRLAAKALLGLQRLRETASPAVYASGLLEFAAEVERRPETWRARFLLGRIAHARPGVGGTGLPALRRAAQRLIEPLLPAQRAL